MNRAARITLSVLAPLWIAVVLVWGAWAGMTHYIGAEAISAARWQRAMRQRAKLPILWTPERGRPPLLPAAGRIIVRDGEVLLNGFALVPGTFGTEPIGISVAFRQEAFRDPPELAEPLLPFWPQAEATKIQRAQVVDLCWGVSNHHSLESDGLRLRWYSQAGIGGSRGSGHGSVRVYAPDNRTVLFPGIERISGRGESGWCKMGLVVDGAHVSVYINDLLVMDFHTTQPLPGAVGVATHEGVATIGKIEVYAPE